MVSPLNICNFTPSMPEMYFAIESEIIVTFFDSEIYRNGICLLYLISCNFNLYYKNPIDQYVLLPSISLITISEK